MTDQERIAQLEGTVATLAAYVRELLAENAALKRRLAQDSQNSSKPPASDGLARRPRPTRRPSGKKPGGQPGHPGHPGQTLALVETPDVVERHAPTICGQCQQPLEGVPGTVVERRQVQDLPPLRLEVMEHQVVAVCCPACQAVTRGVFPAAVRARAQYGGGDPVRWTPVRLGGESPKEVFAWPSSRSTRLPIRQSFGRRRSGWLAPAGNRTPRSRGSWV